MAVVQILDRFFAKGAKHELNIPSNISKALVLSINKRKNIHPEVFNDAMENVLQMLKLSSFPNFYKSALAKGEIKERTEENEYEISHESFIEPILNIPDVRKFSTNNIFQKLETWSMGANAPGSKESFHGSGIFETKSTASQHSLTSIKAPTLAAKGKRRASTIADINTVLEDGYSKPYSLDDFQSFLKAEHSEENIQYYMALQEYKTLCKKVPSAILHDVSCIPQDSPFSGHIGKIVSSMNQMLEIYFTNDATTELNIPSKLLKPFLAAVREKHNFHPDIFKPITENVLLMMKLSSFPNFQKLASSKGSLELKLTVKQVLDDQHPSPMSLNDFHNFMIRENDEAKIGFYLACKEFEDLCEKIGKDEETPQETSGHDLNQLSQAQNKRNNIMQLYISEGAKYDLKLPADLQNAITADSSWNPKIFDPVVDHILTVLKESVFPLFLREVQGSNRKQRESELSQTQSYSEKRSASASSTEFKPTVLQVLEDKCESPFSLNDFHQFIINEHSEENYDFYMAVKDHQYHCERISPDILRDVSQLKIGTPDWFKVEPLKQAIDSIRSKFLSPGSDTELNIPAKIMKPLLAHLDGKKTIHPEIFDAAVDNVLTMMRLSSFPVFCKSASAKGPARLKATLLAVLEDEVQSPHSLQEFREYLQTQNLEGNIKFFFWLQTYQELCSKIPKPLLLKCDEALIDDVHFVSVENAKAEISVALESFFGADGSIRVAAPIKAGIVEAIKKHSNICPDVFDPALAAVMTQLKTSFNQFQKDIHGRNSKSAMTKIIASQENAQPRNSETTWGDMVAFTKLLSRPKTAVSKASESEKDVKSELNSDIKSEPSPTVKQTGVLNDVESKRSSNRISGLSDFKPTVLQVLEDQLCPPFSQQDFHAFIINEHSEENYDFYMAVKSYQELCEKIPEELLKDSSESANEFLMPKIERAKEAIAAIHLKFLTPGSDTELNIPAKILNPLRLELQEKKNIHPEIFTDALDNVLTMMRLSSFPVFCKSASAKGDPKLKPTIQQVLDDLLPPPLSRKDFYEFLKKEHSEENYEFYMSLKNYERQCAEIPTELLKNSAEVDASDSYYSSILSAKSAVNEMMATFFVTDGKFELNIPIHLKNTLKDEINVKANIHPDLFQDILGSILMAWRFSSFPNFQKEATSLPAVQPPELTISGIGTDSSSADSPAGECSRLSPNLLSKQRPKSWAANLMGGRKLSFSKVAVGDEMKATVQEIWDNEFAPPFSLKDYEKYLVDEGDTAALEFYKSLIEYRKLCQTIPDEQLRNSKAYKDSQLSTAFFSVIQMLAKFFARGAKQDIKVPADTLKVLLAQVNEKRNIHPEVFQEALEFVLTQQKLVHFPNFYTLASAKGSLRLSKKKSPKQEESMSKPLFARGRRLSSSAGKLDGALCKKIAESGLDQSSSLKNIDALQVKQATNTKSDPAMELRGENEEGGQAASFAGYSNVPTSPVVPRLKRASSLTKPGRVSENHRSKLDQLEDSVRMSVHRSSVAGLSKPSKTRRSSILADADNGIKFGVLQVLEDQFSPPFSMKDFHRFLIREYSDENIDFYLALKEFRRICEYIPGDQLRGDSEAVGANGRI
ncbi:RGS domain-containing protein [Obelidium mucronatum]|nr:RGS domain-containing protein [Obelidium mucronatum]